MIYLVAYDLNKKDGSTYKKASEKVVERIMQTGTSRCKILNTTWLIKTQKTSADDVYNLLVSVFDKNDRLIVSRFTSDHNGWLDADAVDWIKKNPQ